MTPEQIQEVMQFLRAARPENIVFRTLFGECRGEPIEAQVGVGCVLRSRVKDQRWPDNYNDVALQPVQFSCFNPQDPNFERLMDPEAHEKLEVIQQLRWVATGIVDDLLRDNVAGANHYYDFSVIVGQGQQRSEDRLRRYLRAVDVILRADHVVGDFLTPDPDDARDLIHTLVKDLPPKWDDEVLPVARKGRLVFFKL